MRLNALLPALVIAASLVAFPSTDAEAQRRINGKAQANKLMGELLKAKGDNAARIEEEIATLATDLNYMDQVEPVLISGLKSKNTKQRAISARVLRYTFSGKAVTPLSDALAKDRATNVRMEAVTSLCILKADGAVGALRRAGTADKDAKVRAAAQAALDVIEDREGGRKAGCRVALQKRLDKLASR